MQQLSIGRDELPPTSHAPSEALSVTEPNKQPAGGGRWGIRPREANQTEIDK